MLPLDEIHALEILPKPISLITFTIIFLSLAAFLTLCHERAGRRVSEAIGNTKML